MGVPLGDVTDNVIAGLISKGKHSLGGIQGLPRSGRVMDPCTTSKVYWSVCISRMLYGAESSRTVM